MGKELARELMRGLAETKGELQEHILTCVYDLAGSQRLQKALRELTWEESLHSLIEVYPKFRDAVTMIIASLSRV